ncbi:carbohydrate esterase, putative (DUF303) isoform X2 [Wolffia australiana]
MEEEEKEVDLLPPGDVFLLAGQSNMAGRGGVAHRRWDGVVPIECRPRPQILRFSAQSRWTLAEEPIHADIDAAKTCGVGPAMPFASALLSASPRPIGLVPCAVGGTAIADWAKGKKLYERMVGRAREALQWGAELKALLWFQGESDASSRESASAYGSNMEKLVSDLRSDLGLPSLPVIQIRDADGTVFSPPDEKIVSSGGKDEFWDEKIVRLEVSGGIWMGNPWIHIRRWQFARGKGSGWRR